MYKELVFFHIIFALTLTTHNIYLTHITPSILISANALGYILSIKVKFVMRNMKNEKTNKTAYFNIISCNSANIQARVPFS